MGAAPSNLSDAQLTQVDERVIEKTKDYALKETTLHKELDKATTNTAIDNNSKWVSPSYVTSRLSALNENSIALVEETTQVSNLENVATTPKYVDEFYARKSQYITLNSVARSTEPNLVLSETTPVSANYLDKFYPSKAALVSTLGGYALRADVDRMYLPTNSLIRATSTVVNTTDTSPASAGYVDKFYPTKTTLESGYVPKNEMANYVPFQSLVRGTSTVASVSDSSAVTANYADKFYLPRASLMSSTATAVSANDNLPTSAGYVDKFYTTKTDIASTLSGYSPITHTHGSLYVETSNRANYVTTPKNNATMWVTPSYVKSAMEDVTNLPSFNTTAVATQLSTNPTFLSNFPTYIQNNATLHSGILAAINNQQNTGHAPFFAKLSGDTVFQTNAGLAASRNTTFGSVVASNLVSIPANRNVIVGDLINDSGFRTTVGSLVAGTPAFQSAVASNLSTTPGNRAPIVNDLINNDGFRRTVGSLTAVDGGFQVAVAANLIANQDHRDNIVDNLAPKQVLHDALVPKLANEGNLQSGVVTEFLNTSTTEKTVRRNNFLNNLASYVSPKQELGEAVAATLVREYPNSLVSTATVADLEGKLRAPGHVVWCADGICRVPTQVSPQTTMGSLDISGENWIEFGKGVSGKFDRAGRIRYGGGGDPNALNITGAGTTDTDRLVKIHDNLEVKNNLEVKGVLTVTGDNSGNNRGIRMWRSNDPHWGIYTALSGTGNSLNNGVAPSSDRITSYAIRFRAVDGDTNGFIFENSTNQPLVSINSATTNAQTTFHGDIKLESQKRIKMVNGNDEAHIYFQELGTDNNQLVIETRDNYSEPIVFRQVNESGGNARDIATFGSNEITFRQLKGGVMTDIMKITKDGVEINGGLTVKNADLNITNGDLNVKTWKIQSDLGNHLRFYQNSNQKFVVHQTGEVWSSNEQWFKNFVKYGDEMELEGNSGLLDNYGNRVNSGDRDRDIGVAGVGGHGAGAWTWKPQRKGAWR